MEEHNISIDINTSKLLDWLISRRHVSKDWQNNIIKIREKINNAIQDMPAHEGILKLLSGQHINYFHCLKIVEILKETEADSKNMFGNYGSKRMKDWQDILTSYQKDNVYLAEGAQVLIRNVTYEVPSLKKQVLKFEQSQSECEKKIKDYTRAENLARNEFNALCKHLGIKGEKIKKELIELLDELPMTYKKSTNTIKNVQNALNYYYAFIKFQYGKEQYVNLLNTLEYLIKNGNTTTYEFTYREKPLSIESPQLNISDDEEETKKGDEIDFGDEINFGVEGEIDYATLSQEITVCSEIDWGTTNTEDSFEIVEHGDVGDGIYLETKNEESGIVVEKGDGIAKGPYAYTIMDNPNTRDMIINDLMELETFLKMRMYEFVSDSDFVSMSSIDLPPELQMQSIKTITSMNDSVQIALNELTNKRIQHLHNIKHSAKYVDILTANLKQKLSIVERMQGCKTLLEEKIVEIGEQSKKLGPVINKIITNTKKLQKDIEEDISKKYKGRSVNIIGGVNIL